MHKLLKVLVVENGSATCHRQMSEKMISVWQTKLAIEPHKEMLDQSTRSLV